MRFAAVLTITAIALLSIWIPAQADNFSGDLDKLRKFLDVDTSYSTQERAEAEAALAKLRGGASNMSPAAFQLAVAHIAALAHNGHTMLPAGVWQHQFNRTALQYHMFADGLFVVSAPETMRELIGARVVAIDGHAAGDLVKAFGQYFGGREGKRDEWAPFLLESPALLHAAGLAKADNRVEVELDVPGRGKVVLALLAALDPPKGEILEYLDYSRLVTTLAVNLKSGAATPLYLSAPGQAFLSATLPELDAHYVHLRINKSFYEQKIDDFFARARAEIAKAMPKNLIVDLRLDGGGDLNTTRAFMQELPTLAPGKIFILTSGRTFSAGIASAGYLKQAAGSRVTIVGEPIGDYLEFWAEGGFTRLPVSGAFLLAATERHNYVTGCQEADCHGSIRKHPIRVKSLEPDIAGPLTYADFQAGRDPALEAVRKALGK